MKKSTIVLAFLLAILFCGCSTTAMKGTPFYTGEYAKREGPASDRVNLWPLAYYRDPALSILWPIGEFADDRFAIRPLFSMYRDGKDEPWYEYNSLFGLISVDTRHHRHMFLPLYYRDEEYDTFLSLLYAQGRDWYAIPPLLSWWDDNGNGTILLGLGGWDDSQAWAFPFFYRAKASETLKSVAEVGDENLGELGSDVQQAVKAIGVTVEKVSDTAKEMVDVFTPEEAADEAAPAEAE